MPVCGAKRVGMHLDYFYQDTAKMLRFGALLKGATEISTVPLCLLNNNAVADFVRVHRQDHPKDYGLPVRGVFFQDDDRRGQRTRQTANAGRAQFCY